MREDMDYPAVAGPDVANTESEGLQRWQHAGRWFRYGEHAVFSRIGGEGEALLLLHGFPSASWDWHRLWPALTARYRVMVADMLGFGFSDKPQDYPYSIIDQADLQQGWLEEMGVERVHILAHDYGATVAQKLLARDQQGELPFSVASVCLLNGAIFPEVHLSGQPMLSRYRELIGEQAIMSLPGIGHYPHVEVPGEVLQRYLRFRDAIPPQKPE
mgnify:CR=1 FL=1